MTLAYSAARFGASDVVALVAIIWLVLAIVAAPFIGEHLARRRRRDTRAPDEDDRPVGYRPPRD